MSIRPIQKLIKAKPTLEGASAVAATLAVLLSLPALTGLAAPAFADDKPPKDPWQLKLFRFEFDNDTFLGSDDAFTAGWSFQVHSRLMDTWNPAFAGWIGRVPGLGDDKEGGRIVRWAYGLSQIIITPEDVSIAAPQPDDAPWAGILGAYLSWSAYDNRRLAALQAYLGCMGPCSQAEEVQTFIHDDLGLGTPPEGWDNQLVNQVLGNVNYAYAYKLLADQDDAYAPGRFANDLSIGTQVALGNLVTYAQGWVEYRFGWGAPMGFTKTADPPALGIALDPVYFDPTRPLPNLKRWRAYFNLVGRATHVERFAPLEGGETENGGFHPEIEDVPGEFMALFGTHIVRVPFGFHLTYYTYLDETEVASSLDWVNISLEWRF